jgi:hypothetical protein
MVKSIPCDSLATEMKMILNCTIALMEKVIKVECDVATGYG